MKKYKIAMSGRTIKIPRALPISLPLEYVPNLVLSSAEAKVPSHSAVKVVKRNKITKLSEVNPLKATDDRTAENKPAINVNTIAYRGDWPRNSPNRTSPDVMGAARRISICPVLISFKVWVIGIIATEIKAEKKIA